MDNPDINELKLLETEINERRAEPKDMRIHQSAAPAIFSPDDDLMADDFFIEEDELADTAEAAESAVTANAEHTDDEAPLSNLNLAAHLAEKKTPLVDEGIVYTNDLRDAAVTGPKIAPYTIDASRIKYGTIGTAWLADYAVQGIKIADGAVTSSKIAPESITGEHLVDGSIEGRTIRNRSIGGEASGRQHYFR